MLEKKISALSLKLFMWLFLNNNDNIASFLTRILIGFTVEGELSIVRGAFVNHSVNDLLLLLDLLAIASFAFVGFIDNFTFAITIITRSLRLRVHARAELSHASHNTATSTCCALLDSAFFTASAFAGSTDPVSVHCNLGSLSIINLFQGALKWMHDWLALLWLLGTALSTHPASKHLGEDVIHATTASASVLKSILAVLVVDVSLLFVRQHLISSVELLELLFVTTSIRVVFEG